MKISSSSSFRKRRMVLAGSAIGLAVGLLIVVKLWDSIPVEEDRPDVNAATEEPPLSPEVIARLEANRLSEEKQEHIWKIEHATFELETWFGKPFREALASRDKKALAGFLQEDVEATVLPFQGEKRTVGPLAEIQVVAKLQEPQPSNGPGLVQALLESTRSLTKVERTRFRILALDTEDGKEWTSEILVECAGPDADGAIHLVSSQHDVKFTFSSDEEIKGGRIISEWHDRNRSLRSSEALMMEEVSSAVGLADVPLIDNWTIDPARVQHYWFQLAVEDFNRDGFPDIVVGSVEGLPVLLRSDRCQTFVDVTRKMNIKPWVTSEIETLNVAAWIDFDNDGWPDLLLGDRLYRNRRGEKFDDVTRQSGLTFGTHMMGAVVADYDCDGLSDIYILKMLDSEVPQRPVGPRAWVSDNETGAQNQLWRNEGGGRFRDVTKEANAGGGTGLSFAAAWHFLDDDHYPDLYIANDFGENVHLKNLGNGSFEDVSIKTGTAGFSTTMGVCSGDINNDGRPEIYSANMFSKMGRRIIQHVSEEDYSEGVYAGILGACAGNRLYTPGLDSGKFREISELAGVNQVGWAFAPAMADFNADGWLDIYAATGFMSFDRKKPDG
jgi:hypothetical protein